MDDEVSHGGEPVILVVGGVERGGVGRGGGGGGEVSAISRGVVDEKSRNHVSYCFA